MAARGDGVDFRRRVGHGEDDCVVGHRGDVVPGEDVARGDADQHVRAGERLLERSLKAARIGVLRQPIAVGVRLFAEGAEGAVAAAADDVGRPVEHEETDDRRARCADAGDDDPRVFDALADELEGVDERREGDDRGSVLIVVEHRDVELLAQALLDFEAPGRRDVFQVDPAVDRCDGLDDGDDLLGVLGVEAHGPRVDVAESLEQGRLALHDRKGRLGADVAEAEDGGSVGDHRDGVSLDGQAPRLGRVLVDRLAHARDAGRVDAGEILPGAKGILQLHRDLAADVRLHRGVGDLFDDGSDHHLDVAPNLLDVGGVDAVAGDRDDQMLLQRLDRVDSGHEASGVRDRLDEVLRGPRVGGNAHAKGNGVAGTRHCHRNRLHSGRLHRSLAHPRFFGTTRTATTENTRLYDNASRSEPHREAVRPCGCRRRLVGCRRRPCGCRRRPR